LLHTWLSYGGELPEAPVIAGGKGTSELWLFTQTQYFRHNFETASIRR